MELTKTQLEFLVNYQPATRGCSSADEMKECISMLELGCQNLDELRDTRNNVVMFYTTCLEKAENYKDNIFYMNAMSAITGIIDYVIIYRGGEA